MNIVLVVDQFDDGNNGTTVTARRYAHELRKLGHRVTILAGGEPAEHKICAPNHTIPFFDCPFYFLYQENLITVPVLPSSASMALSKEVMIAFLSGFALTNFIAASTFGSMLPGAN